MSRIMNLVKRVPDPIRNNLVFKKTVEASLVVDKSQDIPSTSQQPFTQDDLQFWDCQEHLDALAKIEEEALKVNELKKELDIPSFSLGFTQEWSSTLEVAREVAEMDGIDEEMIDVAVLESLKTATSNGKGRMFEVANSESILQGEGSVAQREVDEITNDGTRTSGDGTGQGTGDEALDEDTANIAPKAKVIRYKRKAKRVGTKKV